MPDKLCINCCISGRVQGVWFRASTQEKAKELGLKGWARNLPDGRVEVLACGDREQLKLFHEWLHQGPELAKVTDVTYQELPFTEMKRFSVQ